MRKQKSKKSGRPKSELKILPKNWGETAVLMYTKGCSDVEVRAALGVTKDVWYRFMKDEPLFSETIKRARELCEAWWEKQGREGLYHTSGEGAHRNLNPTLWYMNMKNRFGWRDKQEVKHEGSIEIKKRLFDD